MEKKCERLEIPSPELQNIQLELKVERLFGEERERIIAPTISRVQLSAVLDHARTFLPLMQSANEDLSRVKDKDSINIENVPEGAEHVEMNLSMYEDNSEEMTEDSESDSSSSEEEPADSDDEVQMGNKSQIL